MIVTVGRIARWRAYSADDGTNRGMEVATYNLAYPATCVASGAGCLKWYLLSGCRLARLAVAATSLAWWASRGVYHVT
jgi:hypothetical protein